MTFREYRMTKRKYKGSNRREIIYISAVVFILLCVMLVQSSQLKDKNAGYAQQVEKLNAQLEEESERTEDIAQLQERVKTEEYAGEIAKEKLGMVGEDEILFRAQN